jgi:hypothetical protein
MWAIAYSLFDLSSVSATIKGVSAAVLFHPFTYSLSMSIRNPISLSDELDVISVFEVIMVNMDHYQE